MSLHTFVIFSNVCFLTILAIILHKKSGQWYAIILTEVRALSITGLFYSYLIDTYKSFQKYCILCSYISPQS